MRTGLIFLLLILFAMPAYAQLPKVQWVKSREFVGNYETTKIVIDNFGNSFIIGNYNQSEISFGYDTLFNSGPAGSYDIYIVKYSSEGNYIWSKSFGGSTNDHAAGACVDRIGNVFVSGSFNSTEIIFGTDTLVNNYTSGYTADLFITKIDSGGTIIWANSGGGNKNDAAGSIATDDSGNVYMSGSFSSSSAYSINFDTITLYNHIGNGPISYTDFFIVKYDPKGNVIWASSYGGYDNDWINDLAVDRYGNVYATGVFSSPTIDFDNLTIHNSGLDDVFVVKYNNNGIIQWANSAGGYGADHAFGLALDSQGAAYIIGRYGSSAITFDTTVLNGSFETFIVKYDSIGKVIWANSISSSSSGGSRGISIATDYTGVYIVGQFRSSTIKLDSTILYNADQIRSSPDDDCFLAKFNFNGDLNWAKSFGTIKPDGFIKLAVDSFSKIYISGYTWDTLDIDPGPDTFNIVFSYFIIKFDQCYAINASFTHTPLNLCVADSMTFNDLSKDAIKWNWEFGDGTTSDLQNPVYAYSNAGNYTVKLIVTNTAGCIDSVSKNITVDSTCVWPGDANSDNIVDGNDILAIGVAYSSTGSNRTNATQNWQPQFCADWSNSFSNSVNYKHADCDGNGAVDLSDTSFVSLHYSKTHNKNLEQFDGDATDPELKVVAHKRTYKAGDTLEIDIYLGTEANPAENISGLRFILAVNEDFADLHEAILQTNQSWLGSDLIAFRIDNGIGLDIAITRKDQINKNGFGKIAALSIPLKAEFTSSQTDLFLRIFENKVISADESLVPVHLTEDSVKVNGNISVEENEIQTFVKVYPNPVDNNIIYIELAPNFLATDIELYDLQGKLISNKTGKFSSTVQYPLPQNLREGVYLICVKSKLQTLSSKIIVK